MKVTVKQKDKEIYLMVIRLLKMSRTSLFKVCQQNNMKYQRTVQRLNAEKVDIDFLRDIISKINPDATLKDEFSLSLMLGEKTILNYKSE
jgi:hypothetical protein